MNWRKALFSGVLAIGLVASVAPRAEAKHYQDYSYGQCGEIGNRINRDQSKINELGPSGRHRKALRWFQDDLQAAYRDYDQCRYGARYEPQYDSRYDPRYDRRYDTRYDPQYDPRYDQRYDPRYGNGQYDPYYDRNASYDPFDYDGDGKFKFKHDWPALLGIFANTQLGQ